MVDTESRPPPALRAGSYSEADLADLARLAIEKGPGTLTAASKELGKSVSSISDAVNLPERSMTALRISIIERWGGYSVEGPMYRLKKA